MSLRDQLEAFDNQALVLVLTTLGQVYVGRIVDIEGDAIRIARPDGGAATVLNLNDVSGVREYIEEAEHA